MAATMCWVRLRARGIARQAVLAAIGQPTANPPSRHKIIPSADIEERQRPLTTKAAMAGIMTGKTNLILPSMPLSEPLH